MEKKHIWNVALDKVDSKNIEYTLDNDSYIHYVL